MWGRGAVRRCGERSACHPLGHRSSQEAFCEEDGLPGQGPAMTAWSRAACLASSRECWIVMRCRPGTVPETAFAKVPDQRRTAVRCAASGTRGVQDYSDENCAGRSTPSFRPPQRESPESITTACEYGFRARAFGAPRNDSGGFTSRRGDRASPPRRSLPCAFLLRALHRLVGGLLRHAEVLADLPPVGAGLERLLHGLGLGHAR